MNQIKLYSFSNRGGSREEEREGKEGEKEEGRREGGGKEEKIEEMEGVMVR